MKKFIKLMFPCLMFLFEASFFLVKEGTIEFFIVFFGFIICMFVSAYLWRKELF